MSTIAIEWPYRLRKPNREAEHDARWRYNLMRDRLTSGERRAAKLGVLVEKVSRKKLYRMYMGRCGLCGERVRENRFEIDHYIPLSKGGEHSYENCVPAHPVCNRLKADKMPSEVIIPHRRKSRRSKGYMNPQQIALRQ